MRIIVAGAPPPTKTVARVEAELGWEFIQIYGLTETSPLLTVNRAARSGTTSTAEERAPQAGPRRHAGDRRDACEVDDEGEVLARSNVVPRGLLGAARGDRARRSRTAGSTPATAA